MNYIYHIATMVEIFVILALALDLLAGWNGLLSLSQAAFYGTGAYLTAILSSRFDVAFPLLLVIVAITSGALALPVVLFARRLRDLYFTLATLAWQVLVYSAMYNWVSVTNGPFGIVGIPRPAFFGLVLNTPLSFCLMGGVLAAIIAFAFMRLYRSPLARLFQGSRDDQLALMTLGKDPRQPQGHAVVISGAVSGMAGALFASYFSYIDPTSFTLEESILVLSMVLIGGMGMVRGAIAGALFYVLLPEAVRFLYLPDATAANLRVMIYAGTLLLVVMFKPHGLFGRMRLAQ